LKASSSRLRGSRKSVWAIAVLSKYSPGEKLLLRADVARSPTRDDTGHAQASDRRSCDRGSRTVCRRPSRNTSCPLVPAGRPSALCLCRYDVRTRRQRNHGLRERLPRAAQLSDTGGFADFAHALPNQMQSPWRPLRRDGLLPSAGGHRRLDALLGSHLNRRRPRHLSISITAAPWKRPARRSSRARPASSSA
jgi:hypothetical protein